MLKKIGIVFVVLMAMNSALALAAPAELSKTGQRTSYGAGSIDDGALQRGVAWPEPRFAAVSSGTGTGTVVVDNLTGLTWAGDGGTPTFTGAITICTGGTKTWQDALNYVACLNYNSYLGHTDWRLPNINELESLTHVEFSKETTCAGTCWSNAQWLNTQGFSNMKVAPYWSSTMFAGTGGTSALYVDMYSNSTAIANTGSYDYNVLPVRGGL